MNTKIKTWIGTVIVIIIAITVGVFFWVAKKNIPTEAPGKIANNNIIESQVTESANLNCEDGWQEYKQDIIGLDFCYPAGWGEPKIDEIPNLTRLSKLAADFDSQNIAYSNSLDIKFENNKEVNLMVFNDQYDGKSDRDINEPSTYYASGVTDDIVNLKNTGNICDYKIGYSYAYNNEMKKNPDVLKTVYENCGNAVKTVLTQDKEFFNFENIGTLYTYDLRLLAFKKLSNGYLDNMLISRDIDRVNQIHEELSTVSEFFTGKKTTQVKDGVPTNTEQQFDQERKEFEDFIGNIKIFKPIPKSQVEFRQIPNEDPSITTIRKYYWLISSGKLDEAYAMYADKAGTSREQFQDRYKNTYIAESFNFKILGNKRYEFHVKYQDHNAAETEYRVSMDISSGMVKTIFLEKYNSDVVKFGNMTAYSARRGNKNYVFLNQNDKEMIIDQGVADYDQKYSNLGDVKSFGDIHFSPKGKYLLYRMYGWEWSVGYIYDITKGKNITGTVATDLGAASDFGFTTDEKNFYMCSSAGMASGPGGKIYSVPGFEVKYNVLDDQKTKNFMNVDCPYNSTGNSLTFKLSSYADGDNVQEDKKLDIKYDLINQKASEIIQ
jgi:hypothetical protein